MQLIEKYNLFFAAFLNISKPLQNLKQGHPETPNLELARTPLENNVLVYIM